MSIMFHNGNYSLIEIISCINFRDIWEVLELDMRYLQSFWKASFAPTPGIISVCPVEHTG